MSADGSEKSQDARQDSKQRTVHGQQLKNTRTKEKKLGKTKFDSVATNSQTRSARTMTMTVTHSMKIELTRAGHLALQASTMRSRPLEKTPETWLSAELYWLKGVSGNL